MSRCSCDLRDFCFQVREVGPCPKPDDRGTGFRIGQRGGAPDAFGGAGDEDVEAAGGGGGGGDEGVGVVVEGGGESEAWGRMRRSVGDGGERGDWGRGVDTVRGDGLLEGHCWGEVGDLGRGTRWRSKRNGGILWLVLSPL